MLKYEIELNDDECKKCKDFAINSSKTQRENRSGGTQQREVPVIAQDTLRGKVAEVAVKHFLEQTPLNVQNIKLDFDIYPRGEWDSEDIMLKDKRVSIKSAKHFSNWLLLESKDINRGDVYDYYILVTVSPDFKKCKIRGYATKNDILNDANTLKLKKDECIPNTNTKLDADNHARNAYNLKNTQTDWLNIV